MAVDAAAEEQRPAETVALAIRGPTWGDFDIPAASDFVPFRTAAVRPGSLRKWAMAGTASERTNTYTGGNHIAQGIPAGGNGLENGEAGAASSATASTTASLEFDRGDDVAFAGRISGRGSVHFLGPAR